MKKILLSLFVLLFGFINFSNAGNLSSSFENYTLNKNSSKTFSFGDKNGVCLLIDSAITNHGVKVNIGGVNYNIPSINWAGDGVYCWSGSGNFTVSNTVSATRPILVFHFNYDCPVCDVCQSQYTSLECQQVYNLIPISSVDSDYCITNGFCSSEMGSGDYTGDLQYSNIYINDIFHPGKQNIFINIPDYITWDYSQNEVDFNVYVGSGYDVDYINSIVDINSYRPTSEDFTNVFVSGLTLVFPYIFVVLLILFIWKLIKRIFK